MSKKSFYSVTVAIVSLLLAGPTLAAGLATLNEACDAKHPNAPYHQCKIENNCGQDKVCKAACNAKPEVQAINKFYDACIDAGFTAL